MSKGNLDKLAAGWVKGLAIEWHLLYGKDTPRRISLPTYPFERKRYWLTNNGQLIPALSEIKRTDISQFTIAPLHPLVHQNTSTLTEQRFSTTFTGSEFFLADHQVRGQKVLPGVAYLEMARAAGKLAVENGEIIQLKDVVWLRPLVVDDKPVETQVGLYPAESGEIAFEVRSRGEVHSQGQLVVGQAGAAKRLDLGAIQACCHSTVEREAYYQRFREQGLVYGPSFQGVVQFSCNAHEALARLRLPAAAVDNAYVLHPSLLDGALQSAVGWSLSRWPTEIMGPCLPFAIQALTIYRALPEQVYAYVRHSDRIEPDGSVITYDIDLTTDQGEICIQLKGFTVRVLSEPASGQPSSEILYSIPTWQVHSLDESHPKTNEGSAVNSLLLIGLDQEVVETITTTFQQTEVVALSEGGSDVAGNVMSLVQKMWSHLKALVEKKSTKSIYKILVVAADSVDPHLYAPLVGLLKTARLEQPHIWGKVITVSNPNPDSMMALLGREIAFGTFQHIEIQYDEVGTRTAKILNEIKTIPQEKTMYLRRGGVYWITGGMGGLGRIYARHLMEQGEGITVILSSRSELDETGWAHLAELNQTRGTVAYLPADITVKHDVERVVRTITERYGPLNGIIHSAGVIRDSLIINKTEAEIEAVLAPKVTGTLNIDAATKTHKLDFMVLFSSIAGVLGNVGQADYAAANAFLDGFARHRQTLVKKGKRFGRTLSINWPLWAEGGMTVDEESTMWLEREMGLTALNTSAGLEAFEVALLQENINQLLVISGDRQKTRSYINKMERGRHVESNQAIELTAAEKDYLFQATENYLRTLLSKTLKLPATRMEPNTPWEKYGIDSIMILNLTRQLEKSFGELPKTLFFEYHSLNALTSYFVESYPTQLQKLLGRLARQRDQAPQLSLSISNNVSLKSVRKRWPQQTTKLSSSQDASLRENEAIAIVGLSGRYPMAETLAEFWQNLKLGRDCIREIPTSRWDHQRYYEANKTNLGKSLSKWGGFLADVDKFDPRFFNISPREAEMLDPQERLFLEIAWQTLEDAGYTRQTLADQLQSRVGVFVGVMWGEYQLYGQEQFSLSSSHASIANRVSYYLDLHGPSMGVDTMCSSSLTAIHLACESIKRGECAAALAGGVNVSIHPNKYLQLSQGNFAASDGRCRSFGEGGDGYVPGEGVGAVLLKPLSQAETDGDQIYGVIKGSSVNHGGKTHGYTVPNPRAQGELIADALSKSGVEAETISYVEAHGTGTALGDPIEIRGLSQAWGANLPDGYTCAIGSVKSNIGHLESAAGIAGLTKVLLQMKYQQLVPSIHSETLNTHINFSAIPFRVQRELTEWKRPRIEVKGKQQEYPRRAGISSFGAGGANAHLIVEEYAGSRVREQSVVAGPQVIVLSARNEEQLKTYAQKLLAFSKQSTSPDRVEAEQGRIM
ncbi:MAG: SDR family NAD(P)-dependent oxidoreductase [Anaerolineae bacterium]|nr:SDR family NAD(P)-dependent oxidoreductase [Anaerolineae bacterium]